MTASKDKGRFAAVAPLSDRGGGAKPAAKDAAPRTRSKKAARIIGALAAASHSTNPGGRPEVSARIDDSAHGEAGGGDRRAAARPDLSPGPSPGSSLGPSPGPSPGPNSESSSGPAPAPALETAAPEPGARHPQDAPGTAAPAQDSAPAHDAAPGMLKITRHPAMWGIASWAAAHIFVNGDGASVIFFGALGVLALGGAAHIDRRNRATKGHNWQRFAAATSFVPFTAIISGRTRFAPGEIGWLRLSAGLGAFIVLLYLHPWLIGVPAWRV